jgi:hypothetical protein
MVKIISVYHAGKDDPIYSGRFILTSHPKQKPQKELDTSERESKEEGQ